MQVHQLRVGGFDQNFSYLLFDDESGEAALIDPCGDIDVIRKAVSEHPRIRSRYILLTHGHRDHCSGVSGVKGFFNAPVAAHPDCRVPHEIEIEDRRKLPLGENFIECLHAPGHTPDSVVYRLSDDSALFTGDTLFIDWCGYCDSGAMFRTMREVLHPLADGNEVYPGHDYGRLPHAPLGEEKRSNPYLSTTDFERFREELKKL